ncbi:MAG: hypothetical protein JO246_01790 [Frankiaceae bacterium]|nr:hypothetical protein [Frankiaceae bacterium]MBV9871509.1 hypothetical protein [Frankiaceae bacterium]
MREIVPLENGSVLLLDRALYLDHAAPSVDERPDGVLSGEIVHFAIDAIAGGITFDVLKRIASRLAGPSSKTQAASADLVRDAITEYLLRSGYVRVEVAELRKVGDTGWVVTGTADAETFRALSDSSGAVIHVRLG